MINYLAKFLPFSSDMTQPLRRLEDKEVDWCWLEQHQWSQWCLFQVLYM